MFYTENTCIYNSFRVEELQENKSEEEQELDKEVTIFGNGI